MRGEPYDFRTFKALTMDEAGFQQPNGQPGQAPAQMSRIVDIPVGLIDARPDQPRQRMARGPLQELTDSVRIHGILQPIRVRQKGDRYEVIAGARRVSAAREARLTTVPAVVVEVGDDEAYLEALVENIQREDLNPVDRAHALVRLRVSLGIQTWEEVGSLIGIRRAHVYRLLSITKLPEEIQEDIRIGHLTEKHGRALHSLRAHREHQFALWDRIHADHLSGDDAIRLASLLRRDASGATPTDGEQAGDLADAAPPSHTRTRDILEAIQRMSQALTAAAPGECATVSAELALLADRIRAALDGCTSNGHSRPLTRSVETYGSA
jgi:ParB/RepB/Spo0J family partition protein